MHGRGRPGGAGGGLAAVAVHGHVGDTGREVVIGDGVHGHDDQRDQHADLGDGCGQFPDAAPGVADVVRVLGHLIGGQLDHNGVGR